MKITRWLTYRYDIRLIVLCPDDVYRTDVVCGRNTVAVNGECDCVHLSLSLQQAVQCYLPDGMPESHWDCVKLPFLERASKTLRIFPIRESERSAVRRAYRKRGLMVQRLGFVSLMKLKVFMAGYLPIGIDSCKEGEPAHSGLAPETPD